MTIPRNQLSTWSNQGAVQTAKATHESIRTALQSERSSLKGRNFEIFLQGSYKNDTNIRGDSDVDVVVLLTGSTFMPNLSRLSAQEATRFHEVYPNADYQWTEFRRDVLATLSAYFGAGVVTEGRKSIKIAKGSNRLPADVVPCIPHRTITAFPSPQAQRSIDGIQFFTVPDMKPVINYPKHHYENGVEKNQATSERYKPLVRAFKNARSHLVDNGTISKAIAPSYFLECFLYNTPHHKIESDIQNSFLNVLQHYHESDISTFQMQNGAPELFGAGSTQWKIDHAKLVFDALIDLWNNW